MADDEQDIRIVLQSLASCELGRLRKAAFIYNSEGIRSTSPRVLGSYAIVYVIKGEGRYQDTNGLDLPVHQGDFILLFPDVGHRYGPAEGERWSEFYIVFEGPVFDLWRQSNLLNPSEPVHHLEPIGYWLKRLQSAVELTSNIAEVHPVSAVCRVQQVLADVLAHLAHGRIDAEDREWLERACDLLDEPRAADQIDWEEIASQLTMSYENFRKKFARLSGIPPAKYRTRKVMEMAIEMMTSGRASVKEIAEQCGFCNEFHFSRRFKQIVGLSPREFRRQLPR